ncbi:protein kinase domain protein [Pelomyxa schiedti]|nr:protein kinase domain protein [Pelomyxa schiedti]
MMQQQQERLLTMLAFPTTAGPTAATVTDYMPQHQGTAATTTGATTHNVDGRSNAANNNNNHQQQQATGTQAAGVGGGVANNHNHHHLLQQPLAPPHTQQVQQQQQQSQQQQQQPPPPILTQVKRDGTSITWTTGKFLGKGGFAHCYTVTRADTGEVFACKVTPKSALVRPRSAQKLNNEIKIHSSLHHHNIVKFITYFEDSTNVYIILELCNNETMMELMKRRKTLTEPEARYWVYQIVSATAFMHSNNVIHRDLKLGNILISNMVAKVGDFGLATTVSKKNERKQTICGTPNYIAPEILTQHGHSFEVDNWSIGVILYTVLLGKPPFETNAVKTTYNLIKANSYSFPPTVPISDAARDLITKILRSNPDERLSLDQILAHSFFTEHTIPKSLPPHSLQAQPALPSTPPRPMHSGYYALPMMEKRVEEGNNPNNEIQLIGKKHSPHHSPHKSPHKLHSPHRSPNKGIHHMLPHTQLPQHQAQMQPPSQQAHELQIKQQYANDLLALGQQVASMRINSDDATQKRLPPPGDVKGSAPPTTTQPPSNPAFSAPSPTALPATTTTTPPVPDYIASWTYNNKYGLGYRLLSGCYGAQFNDTSTVITVDPSFGAIKYQASLSSKWEEYSMINTLTSHDLSKRVILLKQFSSVLAPKEGAREPQPHPSPSSSGTPLYIMRWKTIQDPRFVVFQFSNYTYQMNFSDNTMIVLSCNFEVATFVDSDGNSRTTWSREIEPSREAMWSRLTYAKSAIPQLFRSHQQHSTQQQVQSQPQPQPQIQQQLQQQQPPQPQQQSQLMPPPPPPAQQQQPPQQPHIQVPPASPRHLRLMQKRSPQHPQTATGTATTLGDHL